MQTEWCWKRENNKKRVWLVRQKGDSKHSLPFGHSLLSYFSCFAQEHWFLKLRQRRIAFSGINYIFFSDASCF